MITSIPICFYPMRKIILDDDNAFSQSLLLKMHGENFISYTSPDETLNYLQEVYRPTLTQSNLITDHSLFSDSGTQQPINMNIDKLKQMLFKLTHSDISVLLIDYHMPEMKGTDFLKKIQHLPIKKALITGESDTHVAINAFNSGLINAYLGKNDPNFLGKINNLLFELEWQYFVDLSNFFYSIPGFHYLRNAHFISQFIKIIQENDITAFCLTHIQGNFTAVNKKGNQLHILTRTKTQLLELAEIAKEDGGSRETIHKLKAGCVIPFFDDLEYWQIPANQWDSFLYPAIDVPGNPNIAFAAI